MIGLDRFLIVAQANLEQGAPAAQGAAPAAGEAAGQAAQGAQQAVQQPCGQGDMLTMVVWMLFFVGLMYFLLIRPQKKQRQQHEKLIAGLKKGDRVVTSGGILGTVRGITNTVITIDLGSDVLVQVRKEHVAGLQAEPQADAAKPGSKGN